MPTWPPRRHLCLDCRTLQPAPPPAPGESPAATCLAGAHHRVVVLDEPAGRAALLDRVWGSPAVRARARTAATVGGTGGGLGGALEACSGCSGCAEGGGTLGEVVAAAVLLALAFIAVYVLFLGARALWRWWRRPTLRPRGASVPGLALGPPTGRAGRVAGGVTVRAPLGDACVGFALEAVTRQRGERVLLRDGVTVGFTVELDDGTGAVEIPAGPMAVAMCGPERAPDATFGAYLAEIDPGRRHTDDLDPFAASQVRQVALRVGDRVEVRGPLRPLPGPTSGPAYRGAATTRWIPVGVPVVVQLDSVED